MSQPFLAHIFGSLQSMESSLARIQAAFAKKAPRQQMREDVEALASIVSSMRRTAVRLNIEMGQGKILAVDRSLQIFYGLLTLVKPELLRMVKELSSSGEDSASKASHLSVVH